MKEIFVKDLKVGDTHQDAQFLVDSYEEQTSKNGSKYIKLSLKDNSGKVEGKIWNSSFPYCAEVKPGVIVKVTGTIDEFNGMLQIIVAKMTPITDYAIEDFIATASRSGEDIVEDIEGFVASIENKDIRKFLETTLKDPEIRAKYTKFPAGKSIHHAYIGGLADHVLEMLTIASTILKNHPLASKDIVYAGIILHDIGKIVEFEEQNLVFSYSLEGNMLGHIFIGANWFNKSVPEDFPEELRIRISHIILSHHGKKEYGSPVTPKTYEAVIVRLVDDMSSTLGAVSATYDSYTGVEEFSEKIFALENERLYLRPLNV